MGRATNAASTCCWTRGNHDVALETRIVRAYQRGGLSIRQISGTLEVSRPRVTQVLRTAGMKIPPRGSGRRRPARRVTDPAGLTEQLAWLYLAQRLSSRQIAKLFSVPERRVRTRLVERGITRRPRGGGDRADRHTLNVQLVSELYNEDGLSLREISAQLNAPYGSTIRTAHDAGLRVRASGRAPGGIALIHALYADERVANLLTRYRIPHVPAGRPLWERFPVPVNLCPDALRALYCDAGLSAIQIEMVTGQARATIRKALERHQIPRRPPGGRSPFWYRARARQQCALFQTGSTRQVSQ